MNTKILFSTFLVLASVQIAHAEQCLMMTDDQFKSAAKLLSLTPKILRFCQPCGDATPIAVDVKTVSSKTENLGISGLEKFNQALVVNGKLGQDLAYMYVKIGSDTWANLGLLANCSRFDCEPGTGKCELHKVDSVSPFITEKGGNLVPSPIF
jgi:hypothetical protein